MSAQTRYGYSTPKGHAGGIYDLAPYAVDSFINEAETGVLKFGMGVKVDAPENTQLLIYAAAALEAFEPMMDEPCQTVRMVIIQPRLDHRSEWSISAEELRARAGQIKIAAARALDMMTRDPAEWEFAPGETQCRFCPVKGGCRALARHCLSAAGIGLLDAPGGPLVTPEELGQALSQVDLIEGWIKGIESAALDRLLDGRPVAGWKLVKGRAGPRKWADAGKAADFLAGAGLTDDQIYTREVISPTNAEKLRKTGALAAEKWDEAQGLITRSEPSPVLAPESDPRAAYGPKPAAGDFPDCTAGANNESESKEGKGKKKGRK